MELGMSGWIDAVSASVCVEESPHHQTPTSKQALESKENQTSIRIEQICHPQYAIQEETYIKYMPDRAGI